MSRRVPVVPAAAALIAAALAALAASPARAEDPPESAPRSGPTRKTFWLAAGSTSTLPDFDYGGFAAFGAAYGRLGFRLEGQLIAKDLLGLGSITYEFGRTFRHIVIAGKAGGGLRRIDATGDYSPTVCAGVASHWSLTRGGALILAVEGAVHIDLGSLPLDADFVSTLGIGLSF